MTLIPNNRMADTEKRERGRPPKSVPVHPTEPVAVNAEAFEIMPQLHPPCCGRAQNKRPTDPWWRTINSGVRVASVLCPNCGKRYDYIPAQSRRLS